MPKVTVSSDLVKIHIQAAWLFLTEDRGGPLFKSSQEETYGSFNVVCVGEGDDLRRDSHFCLDSRAGDPKGITVRAFWVQW